MSPTDRDLARAGYITAVLFAPLGFLVAIVLFARGLVGPGIATLLLACSVGAVVLIAALSA